MKENKTISYYIKLDLIFFQLVESLIKFKREQIKKLRKNPLLNMTKLVHIVNTYFSDAEGRHCV